MTKLLLIYLILRPIKRFVPNLKVFVCGIDYSYLQASNKYEKLQKIKSKVKSIIYPKTIDTLYRIFTLIILLCDIIAISCSIKLIIF